MILTHLQRRGMHRILTRKKNPIIASIYPTTKDGTYIKLPTATPITSAVPATAFDLESPEPRLSSKTTFMLSNAEHRLPVFPMSDGSGPTPVPEWKSQKSRRVGLVGMKMGMSTLWDAWGQQRPVTVIKIQDNQVIHSRYESAVKSWMVKIGAFNYENLWPVNSKMLFEFRRFMIHPKRKLMEFRVSDDALLPTGFELNAAHFVPGQFVDLQGITKGKGFQGVMKRHGFKGQPASHGNSLSHRAMGSTGMSTTPGRVFKGKKMPGRMGSDLSSMQSLQVLKVDPHENLLYVVGAVPGNKGGYVRVRDAVKKLERGKCFPEGTVVPYPTFMGDVSKLDGELIPVEPNGKEQLERDPMLRVVGERN